MPTRCWTGRCRCDRRGSNWSEPEFRARPRPPLLLLLDEVRARTLRLLDAVPVEFVFRNQPGLSNLVLWHAGQNDVTVELLALRSSRPFDDSTCVCDF